MKIYSGEKPKRFYPKQQNSVETTPEYMQVLAQITNGKLRPFEQGIGLTFDPDDAKALKLKFPARTAQESLKRFIKSAGLESDYAVSRIEVSPGVETVYVSYEPPTVLRAPRKAK